MIPSLDIVFSSCARPGLLKQSLLSAKKYLISSFKLRYILVEDYVDNKQRRENSLKWIEENKKSFDKIVILEKKAGFGWHFQQAVKTISSPLFFRMEDDQLFKTQIFLDPLIKVMKSDSKLIEISLRRDIDKRKDQKKILINDIAFAQTNFFSDSLGLFSSDLTNQLINKCGFENQLHEKAVLTPASKEFKKYLLGWRSRFRGRYNIHYYHNGKDQRQGSYNESLY